MSQKAAVFEKTYRDYLAQLAGLDLIERASRLGADVSGGALLMPFFGLVYHISPAGVTTAGGQQAGFAESIVLFRYVLMCPDVAPATEEWVTYRSFKDAQPLIGYFIRETLGPIETHFSGKLPALETAATKCGGWVVTESADFDLSIQFDILPNVPLLLRFNDRDDEFPAQCTIFFKTSVVQYLDMESLAILGTLFAEHLTQSDASE